MMSKNTDNIREKYATPDALELAAKDKTVMNKDRGKDEEGYYKAVASVIWKGFTEEDKKPFQNQCRESLNQAKSDGRQSQLEQDPVGGVPLEEEDLADNE